MSDPCKTSALSEWAMIMVCEVSVRYVLDGARARLTWTPPFPEAALCV